MHIFQRAKAIFLRSQCAAQVQTKRNTRESRGRFDSPAISLPQSCYLTAPGEVWLGRSDSPARQADQPAAASVPNCRVTPSSASGLYHFSTANSHFDNSGSSCSATRETIV